MYKRQVGAIAEILDIPGSSVGKIDIGQEATRIGLREDVAAALMNHKKAIRINGREVAFTVSHAKRGGRPAADRSRRAPQRRKSGR